MVCASWLLLHLQLKTLSSLHHSGPAPTFHLTLFCSAFPVQSGTISFQLKQSILRLRRSKIRKIVSENSVEKFTALPFYENKLAAASGKYEGFINGNVW